MSVSDSDITPITDLMKSLVISCKILTFIITRNNSPLVSKNIGRTKSAVCFMDYEKAFDRVNWYKVMRDLVRLGVDWGDRQLCPLSPVLFNIYIQDGVKVNGHRDRGESRAIC